MNKFLLHIIMILNFFTLALQADSLDELFGSSVEQVVTLSSNNDFLVGGVVNPFSGFPSLRQTDLVVKGAQNIPLERIYIPVFTPLKNSEKSTFSDDSYGGWVYFPYTRLNLCTIAKTTSKKTEVIERNACVVDTNGVVSVYSIENGSSSLASDSWGISNGACDHPSGKFDPRNTKVRLEDGFVVVTTADGKARYYAFSYGHSIESDKELYSCSLYLLAKEILPNGKVLRFYYNNRELSLVESRDPSEKFVYASLNFESSPLTSLSTINSSTGLSASYTHSTADFYSRKKKRININLLNPLHIENASSPNFRKEKLSFKTVDKILGKKGQTYSGLASYDGQDAIFQCKLIEVNERVRGNTKFGELKHNKCQSSLRIKQLSLPNDLNEFEPAYEFNYDASVPGNGIQKTVVRHPDGTKVVYKANWLALPESIKHYDKNDTLIKDKIFEWDENQWLKSITISDGLKLLSKKTFEYDRFGNPEKETFEGDLTGNGTVEQYVIRRKYSEDGLHLLLEEENDDGKSTLCSYLPHTNLLISKVTKDRGQVVTIEIRDYDEYNNLVMISTEDGFSHNKLVTKYDLRQEQPFLHMPQKMTDSYVKEGICYTLKSTILEYDAHGNVATEEIYDAENKFCYAITKEYNERGDLLSETNPLGHKATYTYDGKGRLEYEKSFSGKLETKTTNDLKGRPISIREIGSEDGIDQTRTYRYDYLDRLVKKTDHFDHPTDYLYDPFCQYPSTVSHVALQTPSGTLPVEKRSSYDAHERQTSYTDENGNTTNYTYNAYGSPVEIDYPDQSRETFRYTKSGKLESETDRNGLITSYLYDGLGRIRLKRKVFLGETVAQESFIYKGPLLAQKIDELKRTTDYIYDGAGRKIREEFMGRVTTFDYDGLGNIKSVCEENGEGSRCKEFAYDYLEHVLEERNLDPKGNLYAFVKYDYDANGNKCSIEKEINGKKSIETFEYDAINRLKCHTNPCGHATKTTYNDSFLNRLNQKVLQTTVLNPNGSSTIQTYDVYGHVIRKEVLDADNCIIDFEAYQRDAHGNRIQVDKRVYLGNVFQGVQSIGFTYDKLNRRDSYKRALNTDCERTTSFTFTPGGEIKSKTKPDGVVLFYDYDPLGYVKSITLSDETLRLSYVYDAAGRLRVARDEISNLSVTRSYDDFDNVAEESNSKGITVRKVYDRFDRPLWIILPDSGKITYTYDAFYCRQIDRFSSTGEKLFTHNYDGYDLNGNLRSETFPGSLGIGDYTTNLDGTYESTTHPRFNETCKYDNAQNLKLRVLNGVEERFDYDFLNQITSERRHQNVHSYQHDSNYNRWVDNDQNWKFNTLDELEQTSTESFAYDLNGNLKRKGSGDNASIYSYDPLNRLTGLTTHDTKVCFEYDPLGRKIGKTASKLDHEEWKKIFSESYFYDGKEDIGALDDNGKIKQLRLLGIEKRGVPSTIAIELIDRIYAAFQDGQGNICRLIEIGGNNDTLDYVYTSFGETQTTVNEPYNPWQYGSKRFDRDLGLIDYGYRHYSPEIGRWLTTDPADFIDGMNLYAYLKNNPFRYVDPDGRFAFVIPLIAGGFALGSEIIVGIAATDAIVGSVIGAVLGVAVYQGARALDAKANGSDHHSMHNEAVEDEARDKKKARDPKYPGSPQELENNPDWKETTHPEARNKGHREFENTQTGEQVRFDKGKPGQPGHKGKDHYHRYDPNDPQNNYLDINENPIPKGRSQSHLYPPDGIFWII